MYRVLAPWAGNMTRLVLAGTRRHALAWHRGVASGIEVETSGVQHRVEAAVLPCIRRGRVRYGRWCRRVRIEAGSKRKIGSEYIVNECIVSGDSLPRGLENYWREKGNVPTSGARMMVMGASWT